MIRLNRNSPLAAGLVGWWPLDGDRLATDSSLFARHASKQGGPTFEAAQRRGVYFDGSGDYFNVPESKFILPSGGLYTAMAWVRMPNVTDAERRYIIQNDETGKWPLGLEWRNVGGAEPASNQFQAWAHSSSGFTHVNSTLNPSADTWYHVCTCLGPSDLQIFVNGVLDNSTSFTYSRYAIKGVNIGTYRDASARWFEGWISDVRIYGRPLTASEIFRAYAETKNGGYGSLARQDPFLTVPPVSGTSSNLTLLGVGA